MAVQSNQSSPPPKSFWAVWWSSHVLPSKLAVRETIPQASVGKDKNLKVSANKLFYAHTVFFEEAATRFKAQSMAWHTVYVGLAMSSSKSMASPVSSSNYTGENHQ